MSDVQTEPQYLAIGRVLRPHGIRGELRVELVTDYPERAAGLRVVYLGPDYRRYAVVGVRSHQGMLLLQLKGCEDRNAAEALRGLTVSVLLKDAVPLEEGEYYYFQLIGVQVETEDGEVLGKIVEVLSNPAVNDVYVVHGMRGEVLIPGIHEVVQSLDVAEKRMVIRLLPGLLPEDS